MSTAGSFGNHRSEVQASWTDRNQWRSSGQGAVECCNNEWTHWIPVMTITILWFTWSPAPCSWPPWSLGGLGSNRREPSQDFGKQDFEQSRPYYKCKAGTLIIPRISTDGYMVFDSCGTHFDAHLRISPHWSGERIATCQSWKNLCPWSMRTGSHIPAPIQWI